MAEKQSQKCRCNKCNCGNREQALYCSIMGRWMCKACAETDEHGALHFLIKEDNPGIVYPSDFQQTVIKIAGEKPCAGAEQHAKNFEELLLTLKDKKIVEILAKSDATKK